MPQKSIINQAYPAARLVAPNVRDYFARRHAEAIARGDAIDAALPDADMIATILDAAFWASLRREEGYIPRISLAYGPPNGQGAMTFERPLPLRPAALTKVAPAVERAGIHLGVWPDGEGDLRVWGTLHNIPALTFVLEVAAPGLLVIKHHRGVDAHKFVNVAVLEGEQIKIIDEEASNLPPDCPALVTAMLGFDAPGQWGDEVNLMVQLAVSMRAHQRGGSLLIVPAGTDEWRESIVHPFPYAMAPPFGELARLNRERPANETSVGRRAWEDAVERAVACIGGLTAVDGATVMSTDYDLLAFGVKITRRKSRPQVEEVTMTEPIEGGTAVRVHPEQLGGTRHLAAVQFVHDQRDAVALVASQDGRFTIFAWSECEQRVHAHRVEALLF